MDEVTPSDEPLTLEGIEAEHRRWCLYIVYTLRHEWWNTKLTVEELLGSKEENPEARRR